MSRHRISSGNTVRFCLLAAVVLGSSVTGAGCQNAKRGPYRTLGEADQNTERARQLNSEAVDLMDSDPEAAEALLREALTEDIYFGPAHNNLGVLLLRKQDLYGAANEFEWARRLMPGHPDPRLNLGMTLEQAGKVDDALSSYKAALEVYPGHLPSIQALTRAEIRFDRTGEGTLKRLEEIAARSSDPRWHEWAREQLVLGNR